MLTKGEDKKAIAPENLSPMTYNDETWHCYTLPREDPKNIQITWNTP